MNVTSDSGTQMYQQDEKIFSGVTQCIARATGLPVSDISLTKTLVGDLKIDSIDMIDLIYQIEDEFSIEIKLGEMEKNARLQLVDKPFAVENIITSEGLVLLQKMMPEIASTNFKDGMMVQQIPYLFTVESMCRLVQQKTKER